MIKCSSKQAAKQHTQKLSIIGDLCRIIHPARPYIFKFYLCTHCSAFMIISTSLFESASVGQVVCFQNLGIKDLTAFNRWGVTRFPYNVLSRRGLHEKENGREIDLRIVFLIQGLIGSQKALILKRDHQR